MGIGRLEQIVLETAYEEGYRYIVRDKDHNKKNLICFETKPKKWNQWGFWGYEEKDLRKKDLLPAKYLNIELERIKWTNRKPALISDFL